MLQTQMQGLARRPSPSAGRHHWAPCRRLLPRFQVSSSGSFHSDCWRVGPCPEVLGGPQDPPLSLPVSQLGGGLVPELGHWFWPAPASLAESCSRVSCSSSGQNFLASDPGPPQHCDSLWPPARPLPKASSGSGLEVGWP